MQKNINMKINKDYLKERPLSFSSIKQFIRSPQHYVKYLTQEKKQTDAMLLGSVVHALILEPQSFESKYIIEPEFNKRTNQGKEDYQKFLESMSEKNLQAIPQSVFVKAKEMVTQFMGTASAHILQMTSSREQRFDIDYIGIPVCGYIDAMSDEYVIELKTVSSAETSDIQRDFYNLKYHLQAGIYNWVTDKKIMYIVIENSSPYLSRTFIASDSYVSEGRKMFDKAMSDFRYCLDMDLFDRGYEFYAGTESHILELPGWAKKGGDDGY